MNNQYERQFVVVSFKDDIGRFIGCFTELKVAQAYADFIHDLNPARDARVFEAVDNGHGYPAPTESEIHSD